MDNVAYRVYLVRHGIRQTEIAKILGISPCNLNARIRSDRLRTDEIAKIAATTGMSEQEFVEIFYPKTHLAF